MSESIYDVLAPYLDSGLSTATPGAADPITISYINRLTTLDIDDLSSSEPQSIAQATSSTGRSIQALGKRSHRPIISAAHSLAPLSTLLRSLTTQSDELSNALPAAETTAAAFADKYRRSNDAASAVLQRRRDALLLARNVDRVASVLEMPTLLNSSISTGQQAGAAAAASTSLSTSAAAQASTGPSANYGLALDLHAHVKRLTSLYPQSPLISSVAAQSDAAMQHLTTNLIASLRSPNVKLAGAMRTIGWLRRVAPELDTDLRGPKSGPRSTRLAHPPGSSDGALGALFLVCRLASLDTMLQALEPLQELANDERTRRTATSKAARSAKPSSTGGQQTERYLKRYIEIFREQSFAIVSMYKSIFPSALPAPPSQDFESTQAPSLKQGSSFDTNSNADSVLLPLPSPLATFPAHLIDRLYQTLKTYLPNVTDPAARDSLLTQVLYCSGSMGRLGGDFGMMLALLEEDLAADATAAQHQIGDDSDQEAEWVRVMKKHRVQASRLELLASGVGSHKSAVKDIAAS